MRTARFPTLATVGTALGLVMIALVVLAAIERSAVDPAGETWRHGFLGGEQIVLQRDGRYSLRKWGCFGPTDVLETGAWAKLGDTVSLVPSSAGGAPRLMRIVVRDGSQFLRASGSGVEASNSTEWFERVE